MITKHCLRFTFKTLSETGQGRDRRKNQVAPMQLIHGDEVLDAEIRLQAVRMHVVGRSGPHPWLAQPGMRWSISTPENIIFQGTPLIVWARCLWG